MRLASCHARRPLTCLFTSGGDCIGKLEFGLLERVPALVLARVRFRARQERGRPGMPLSGRAKPSLVQSLHESTLAEGRSLRGDRERRSQSPCHRARSHLVVPRCRSCSVDWPPASTESDDPSLQGGGDGCVPVGRQRDASARRWGLVARAQGSRTPRKGRQAPATEKRRQEIGDVEGVRPTSGPCDTDRQIWRGYSRAGTTRRASCSWAAARVSALGARRTGGTAVGSPPP